MISATWNAPREAFDNPDGILYGGKGTDDLFLHITSNYKFCGYDILPDYGAAMKAGSTGTTPWTPSVFCAVSAVMAVAANPPIAVTALMSAWMPAPPPESEPAMVSAIFIG